MFNKDRFNNKYGIEPFSNKLWLSSPTMHGEESIYVRQAIETNWVSTVGENINELEKATARYIGVDFCVGLASGTAALHMCVKLAGLRTNPRAEIGNTLKGCRVFCSDMTFSATVNPVIYEGGTPVFIDTERDTWNMDPVALEKAFAKYPETRIVILAHLYGVPAKMDEIISICRENNAVLIEDAAEAMGAEYHGKVVSGRCGSFGDYIALSLNGNKIITGSSGGFFLTNSKEDSERVRKWSTQSRERAPWYEHEELGYNYRMSNIVAGVARGNMLHIDEHISQKKVIYERYKKGFKGLPIIMNPFDGKTVPNYWLSCMLVEKDAMCSQVRGEKEAAFKSEEGKSCPTEILEALSYYNAEGRPIWKPMHMQPIFRKYQFISAENIQPTEDNASFSKGSLDIGKEIFDRGLCLPSDNKMTEEQQMNIIEIVKACFE